MDLEENLDVGRMEGLDAQEVSIVHRQSDDTFFNTKKSVDK
jgi:hypothetical protein